jgi:hypothetical protein
MKSTGILSVACAVLITLALPAGASARGGPQRRHVQVIEPTTNASIDLGSHGGYRASITLEEPDLAVLSVSKVNFARLAIEQTTYGAHFRGSLPGGRVTADFGAVGSISVRFSPGGKVREGPHLKACEGSPWRREAGSWRGKISLHGEGGYFDVASHATPGLLDRSFRLRCRFKHPVSPPATESLVQQVVPPFGGSLVSALVGTISSLEVQHREHGRLVLLRAAHATGTGPGSEVEVGTFEYQGEMPVGRYVQVLRAPPGSLVTTLPGEHPATATLKPGAPFTGEASYRAVGPTDHSWTGSLAVKFPGLVEPLAGPSYFSTLCVISPLAKPYFCEYKWPSWQNGEESEPAEARR